MYDKFDKYLHGSKQSASKVYSQHFIKKFLRYVSKIRPKISDESSERISTMYMELRGSNDVAAGATPITPRTLETIIRLSCAHAKLRLSALVELQDVEEAWRDGGIDALLPAEVVNILRARVDFDEGEVARARIVT